MRRLIVWGAGTLGSRVARQWVLAGGKAIGVTQTTHRHADLVQHGIEPWLDSPESILTTEDMLLLALPGHKIQQQAVERLQQTGNSVPFRAVFISVTGYYGVIPTETVINEKTPVGQDKRALSIANAEKQFVDWGGDRGVIMRAGGLYCPTRGPAHAIAKRGAPRPGPANKTMALIHYDDLATVLINAFQHNNPHSVYVTVTPPCPTRGEFFVEACEQLALPAPIFTDPLSNPPIQYDVTRLRQELLPNPAYPDWRSALGSSRI
ncbi:hypothetical protein QUF64_06960 [Anaerolineales bacterium HSG6]|nr:hypothetical protein [Anaerolineales bacterium HSG6]